MGQTAELNSAESEKTCNAGRFVDACVNIINLIYALTCEDRRLTQSRSLGVLHAYTSREERVTELFAFESGNIIKYIKV